MEAGPVAKTNESRTVQPARRPAWYTEHHCDKLGHRAGTDERDHRPPGVLRDDECEDRGGKAQDG
jgi:hypothetical protein